MNALQYIKNKQIIWAKRNNIKLVGSQGNKGLPIYTEKIDQNLFERLISKNKKQFRDGDGGETKDSNNTKAKMKALHSSSAIVVNMFQYWDAINKVNNIANACELCNKKNKYPEEIVFEKKYEISERFRFSPNIDVVIKNKNSGYQYKVFAIESKFTEPYVGIEQKGISREYIKLKKIWENIPNTLKLAKSISPNDNQNQFLHAAQLIKHILGLKKEYGKSSFRLLYLWYDVPGKVSYFHRKEIERFADIMQRDNIKFSSISYQKLIINLINRYYKGNKKYIDYITGRYL